MFQHRRTQSLILEHTLEQIATISLLFFLQSTEAAKRSLQKSMSIRAFYACVCMCVFLKAPI